MGEERANEFMDELRLRARGSPASARGTIELLRSCDEGIQRLLSLPLVGLVQDPNEDPLYPHRRLPRQPLLLVGRPGLPSVTAEVALRTTDVPEDAADGVQALVVQQLHDAGKRILLNLP